MNKKKIAILINSLYAGGAERVVVNLLTTLRDDFEVHLLLLRDEFDYLVPEGQKVAFLSNEKPGGGDAGTNMLKLPFVAWRLRRYCKENGIDLVLSFLNRPNYAAGLAKRLGLKAKVVMSERIYTPLFYDPSTLRGKIGGKLVSWLYPYADAILPNSVGTKNALINSYGVENQYFVATNQIPLKSIQRDCGEEVHDVKFDRFTFVCVAGFREQKNHPFLIQAFSRIRSKNAQLLLIGRGPKLAEAKQMVDELGLTDSVLFVGQQENPHKYVSKAQCFVLPSDYEGFPNVILEAMVCGTPVISTDCLTGPRDLLAPSLESTIGRGEVHQGDHGVLVPVGDIDAMAMAMDQMISSPELLARYSAAGRRRASDFDQDTHPDPFRLVINEMLTDVSL